MTITPGWVALAICSGLAAATNGMFAKLVTTTLTSTLSATLSKLLSLSENSKAIDFVVRAIFFGLNLLANAIMWGLFTAALAKGSSATRVSIINTSANFMFTAALGWMVFSESLSPLWWAGAILLVAGSTITGRREGETVKQTDALSAAYMPVAE